MFFDNVLIFNGYIVVVSRQVKFVEVGKAGLVLPVSP
jgi:hypothetical protein